MRTKRDSTRAGVALLLSAIVLAVLIGFVGMAVDLGFFLSTRSQMQTAADLAALAGARDLAAGRPEAYIEHSVRADAALNGAVHQNEATVVKVQTGTDQVAVEIRRDAPTFFSRIFGRNEMTLVSRAVARPLGGGHVALSE
jgi:uncharacterized membrane protein